MIADKDVKRELIARLIEHIKPDPWRRDVWGEEMRREITND